MASKYAKYDSEITRLRSSGLTAPEIGEKLGIPPEQIYYSARRTETVGQYRPRGPRGKKLARENESDIERRVALLPEDRIAEAAIRIWHCVQIEAGLNGGFVATVLADEWSVTGEEADSIQKAVWKAVAGAVRERKIRGIE